MEKNLLVPRRSKEERERNHLIVTNKKIQEYIKNGSKGDLNLSYTPIETLPDNLTTINGDLFLSSSKIKDLNNLKKVNGNLFLEVTPIERLPEGLETEGRIYLTPSPLDKNIELIAEYEQKYKLVIYALKSKWDILNTI